MSDDYAQRFGGIGRLYGASALERLRAAHVCVIGVGGVGSWTVEALARSGVGTLTLIDADDVCITNVNRQLPALDGAVGRSKVRVLGERVRLVNPACAVVEVGDFLTGRNAAELLSPKYDWVVDCVDRMSTKTEIIHTCHELSRNILVCGSAGGRRDGTAVRVTDLGLAGQDELLRQVRRRLRREFGWKHGVSARATPMGVPCVFSPEKPVYPRGDGTCSAEAEPGSSLRMDCGSGFGAATFVTGAFGFAAAGEIVRRMAGV